MIGDIPEWEELDKLIWKKDGEDDEAYNAVEAFFGFLFEYLGLIAVSVFDCACDICFRVPFYVGFTEFMYIDAAGEAD